MGPHDVIYVRRDGSLDTATYDRQGSADLMKADHADNEIFAVQLILGQYEVYRLSDIKWGLHAWSKGPPVFVTPDQDAAITWCLLMIGRESAEV